MTKSSLPGPVEATPLTPAQIAQLRNRIARLVHEALPHAREVMRGDRRWTNVQLGLFRTLVAKIVPDLNQSFAQVEVTNRPLMALSRAELEQIAASDAILIEDDVEALEPAESLGIEPTESAGVSDRDAKDVRDASPCDV